MTVFLPGLEARAMTLYTEGETYLPGRPRRDTPRTKEEIEEEFGANSPQAIRARVKEEKNDPPVPCPPEYRSGDRMWTGADGGLWRFKAAPTKAFTGGEWICVGGPKK